MFTDFLDFQISVRISMLTMHMKNFHHNRLTRKDLLSYSMYLISIKYIKDNFAGTFFLLI